MRTRMQNAPSCTRGGGGDKFHLGRGMQLQAEFLYKR